MEDLTVFAPLKSIRKHCLECSGGSVKEVELCPIEKCFLYSYRFGKNPHRKKREMTEEKKAILTERLKNARKEERGLPE